MIEWSEMHLAIRDAMRRFVEAEVVPKIEAIEHGGEPPYDVLRKMVATFGLKDMAEARFAHQIAKEKAREASGAPPATAEDRKPRGGPEAGNEMAMRMIPIIELCKYSPGMVTALGVSMGLTANAILTRGHHRAEGALGAAAAHARQDRRVGHHRAGLRVRRVRRDEGDRAPRRRRLRPLREQDVHHERPLRRHDRLHLQARRG